MRVRCNRNSNGGNRILNCKVQVQIPVCILKNFREEVGVVGDPHIFRLVQGEQFKSGPVSTKGLYGLRTAQISSSDSHVLD